MKKIITLIILHVSILHVLGESSFLSDTKAPSPLKNNESQAMGYQLQKTLHNIYELYNDSVVFITTEKTVVIKSGNSPFFEQMSKELFGSAGQPKTKTLKGLGTGFIISADGYICTNYHVVEKADYLGVRINNEEFPARIIGADRLTDIALLKIETDKKLKPVYFGDSEKARIGDIVVAIGNPFGLEKTYTFGIVSATGRRHVDELGNLHIQTDASINSGNSGGPLINMDGEVIGINRIIYSNTGGSIGIGFALSVNTAVNTLLLLKKSGRVIRGHIGVDAATITKDFAKRIGLVNRNGVLIKTLLRGGPAHKAGLLVNDIIIGFNSAVINDYRDFITIVSAYETGKSATITAWRNGKIYDIRVIVEERPN